MKKWLGMYGNTVVSSVSILSIFMIILFSTSMNVIYAQEVPFQELFEEPLEDITAPVITVPSDFTVSAMSIFGSSVSFSVSALDDIDGVVSTTCTPPSRSTFPIGSNTVICTATDSAGNIGSASFIITVQDSIAPVVTVPGDLTISTTLASRNSVTFSASASDDIDGFISTTCFPPSGSVFPIGRTTVICTARDSAGNIGSASFVITVQNMITIIQEELVALQEIEPQEIGSVGDEVSRFVHTANSLFELEKQGLKDIQNEFRKDLNNSDPASKKDLRKAFNSDLTDLRNQFQDFRTQYHDIFDEFRHDVKQLVNEAKELTFSDRKQLQQLEKTKLKIQSQEDNSNSNIFTQATISRAIELADNEKDLIKLNHLIQVSQLRGSHIPDDKLSEWKNTQNELKTTIKAYQIVFNNSDKDTKDDFKTIIKQVKNELKQLEKEQKEQNEKNTNSGKKGSDGGSDKKDNKSKSKKK